MKKVSKDVSKAISTIIKNDSYRNLLQTAKDKYSDKLFIEKYEKFYSFSLVILFVLSTYSAITCTMYFQSFIPLEGILLWFISGLMGLMLDALIFFLSMNTYQMFIGKDYSIDNIFTTVLYLIFVLTSGYTSVNGGISYFEKEQNEIKKVGLAQTKVNFYFLQKDSLNQYFEKRKAKAKTQISYLDRKTGTYKMPTWNKPIMNQFNSELVQIQNEQKEKIDELNEKIENEKQLGLLVQNDKLSDNNKYAYLGIILTIVFEFFKNLIQFFRAYYLYYLFMLAHLLTDEDSTVFPVNSILDMLKSENNSVDTTVNIENKTGFGMNVNSPVNSGKIGFSNSDNVNSPVNSDFDYYTKKYPELCQDLTLKYVHNSIKESDMNIAKKSGVKSSGTIQRIKIALRI